MHGDSSASFSVMPSWVMNLPIPASARMLLGDILSFTSKGGRRLPKSVYHKSNSTIAKGFGISARTVSLLVSQLREAGLIKVFLYKNPSGYGGTVRMIEPTEACFDPALRSSFFDSDSQELRRKKVRTIVQVLYNNHIIREGDGGTPVQGSIQEEEEGTEYGSDVTPAYGTGGTAVLPLPASDPLSALMEQNQALLSKIGEMSETINSLVKAVFTPPSLDVSPDLGKVLKTHRKESKSPYKERQAELSEWRQIDITDEQKSGDELWVSVLGKRFGIDARSADIGMRLGDKEQEKLVKLGIGQVGALGLMELVRREWLQLTGDDLHWTYSPSQAWGFLDSLLQYQDVARRRLGKPDYKIDPNNFLFSLRLTLVHFRAELQRGKTDVFYKAIRNSKLFGDCVVKALRWYWAEKDSRSEFYSKLSYGLSDDGGLWQKNMDDVRDALGYRAKGFFGRKKRSVRA